MAERGPAGLTVWDVARRAGVNRGTAYQQFHSRDELIQAVVDSVALRAKRDLTEPSERQSNDGLDQWVQYLVAQPELVRISVFRMLAGDSNPRNDLWADYVNAVRQGAGQASRSGGIDTEMFASILLGAAVFWSLRVQSGGARSSDTARFVRELKRLLLHGMGSPAVLADADAKTSRTTRSKSTGPARDQRRAR